MSDTPRMNDVYDLPTFGKVVITKCDLNTVNLKWMLDGKWVSTIMPVAHFWQLGPTKTGTL